MQGKFNKAEIGSADAPALAVVCYKQYRLLQNKKKMQTSSSIWLTDLNKCKVLMPALCAVRNLGLSSRQAAVVYDVPLHVLDKYLSYLQVFDETFAAAEPSAWMASCLVSKASTTPEPSKPPDTS